MLDLKLKMLYCLSQCNGSIKWVKMGQTKARRTENEIKLMAFFDHFRCNEVTIDW